ncbi:MAG: hypothetical protein KBD27_01980 [Candidatus Moranbacteria bacterium]|nr:hypothetical protein [Candidatus Moranbacteria bacterium]
MVCPSVENDVGWFPAWIHRGRGDRWQWGTLKSVNLFCHEIQLALMVEALPRFFIQGQWFLVTKHKPSSGIYGR